MLHTQRVHPDAKVPAHATDGARGFDLCAWWDGHEQFKILKARQTLMVGTGWKFGLPEPYGLFVLPRSGKGARQGIVLGNLVGLIDSDYQGELMVSAWNRSGTAFTLQPLERLAQMVIVPVVQAQFRVVEAFAQVSERAAGGYGSTGRQ